MIDLIRLGDDTDHGGKVISASTTMFYEGRAVARKGDKVSCPRHDIGVVLGAFAGVSGYRRVRCVRSAAVLLRRGNDPAQGREGGAGE